MLEKVDYKKLLMSFIGIMIMGFGCGMLVKVGYGADTSNSFFTGLSKISGINIGNMNALMSLIMLILVYLLNKKRIGIGTILVPFIISFPVNFANDICIEANNYLSAFLLDIIALFIVGFGAAITIETDLGASPYDALTLAISDFFKIKFIYAKYLIDGFCIFMGFLLGGEIGLGTILCFLLMGIFLNLNRNIVKKFIK